MNDDRSNIRRSPTRPPPAKWGVALGSAVVAGLVMGVVITAFPRNEQGVWMDQEMVLSIDGHPPVIALGKPLGAIAAVVVGVLVGLGCAVAAQSRPVLAALLGGLITAASAAAAIVLWQWQRGRWPVGTIDGRMFVVAGALVVLVCSAAVLAAMAKSLCHLPAGRHQRSR